MYLNRTICTVFEEMRICNETKNYSYLLGLVEEAQSMANKMESKIDSIKQFDELKEQCKNLTERKNDLKKDIKKSGGNVDRWE